MFMRGLAAMLALACVATGRGAEDALNDWWQGDSALPSMAWRKGLSDDGLSFEASFDGYFFGNPVGGQSQAFAYTQSLYFQLEADLEKIAGWKGGSLVWSWADNAGSDLSQTLGNEFQVVGAYGPNTFYFDLLYLQQEVNVGRGTLTLKAGQLTALNDFLVTDMCNYYVNEAFQADVLRGIDVLATYEPEASWGGFAKYEEKAWYVQSGVYQVSDRIGDNSTHGLNYDIQGDDGLIVFAEGCWRPRWAGAKGAYPAHYKAGAFISTWEYPAYDGGTVPSIAGFYALVEQMAWREKEGADEGLYAWSNFIYSPQTEAAQIPWFVSGGWQYVGLLPGRDNDRTVFGAAYGAFSMDQAAEQKAAGLPPQYYELAFEAAYWIAVNQWMTVTPDVQFIVNPGGAHNIPTALVLGVAVGVSF
jgi:porin